MIVFTDCLAYKFRTYLGVIRLLAVSDIDEIRLKANFQEKLFKSKEVKKREMIAQ